MADNSYFPTGYQPIYYPQAQPMQQQPQPQQQSGSSGLVWVQGEAGAKSYLVAPNTTVLLMDSESDVFYLKSTDASGMPLPLRTFSYKEQKTPDREPKGTQGDNSTEYVTRDEFSAFKGQIEALMSAPAGKREKGKAKDDE